MGFLVVIMAQLHLLLYLKAKFVNVPLTIDRRFQRSITDGEQRLSRYTLSHIDHAGVGSRCISLKRLTFDIIFSNKFLHLLLCLSTIPKRGASTQKSVLFPLTRQA